MSTVATKTLQKTTAVSPTTADVVISDPHSLAERFETLRNVVLSRKPVLNDILQKHGEKTLYSYAQDYFDVNIGPGLPERQDELIGAFKKQVGALLGDAVATSAAKQLKKYYFVSTADHHGPLCDPYFLGSNLVTAICGLEKDPEFNNVIVLSCGSIAIDNDTFPRGFTFHSNVLPDSPIRRLAFFSSHERPSLVCLLRAYGKDELEKIKKQVDELVRAGDIDLQSADKIHGLITEVYETPEVLNCASFSDQITKTNYTFWKKIFPATATRVPNLIYLEMENFVSTLLMDHHLDKETIISKMLFDTSVQQLMLKHFDNILGAFSSNEGWGTYLFWAVPKGERYRQQLQLKDGFLVSKDGSYRVALTPAGLRAALVSKEIVPSMLTLFMVSALYYGLKCLGGFSQVNYLTEMKQAYIEIQKILKNDKEIAISDLVQTKEMGEDMTIAFLHSQAGETALATGLDLVLYNDPNTWERLVYETKHITLNEAINPMMPNFYKVVCSGKERDEALNAISSREVTRLIGLDQKIKPCITVK